MRLISTIYSGESSRNFIIGMRLWPPEKQLRIWSKFLQKCHSLVEGAGRVVLKAPRYHRVVTFLHRIDFACDQTERFKREGLDHTRQLRLTSTLVHLSAFSAALCVSLR